MMFLPLGIAAPIGVVLVIFVGRCNSCSIVSGVPAPEPPPASVPPVVVSLPDAVVAAPAAVVDAAPAAVVADAAVSVELLLSLPHETATTLERADRGPDGEPAACE